jgi:hypothetical protein
MNEQQFANKVQQALDERAARLGPALVERLRAARERALASRRAERVPVLSWADNVLGTGGSGGFWLRLVLPVIFVVLGVAGIYSWQQNQRLAEIEEIDAELLTDDLPIDAYLDRGFQEWLKRRGTR